VPTHSQTTRDPAFLRLNGVFIPVQIGRPGRRIDSDRGIALIDFGASMSFVRTSTALGLDLPSRGPLPVLTGGGRLTSFMYVVELRFPTLDWVIDEHTVGSTGGLGSVGTDPPQPVMLLLGRDLLEYCRFEWDGPGHTWSLHHP